MAKDKTEDKIEEKVNQPAGAPVVAEVTTSVSRAVLEHQWQENSPALNTNALAGYANQESALDAADTKENIEARKQESERALELQKEALDNGVDCSKLDVSDRNYCSPGSARHKAYLKSK